MATPTPPDRPSPWHAVHGGPTGREPVAPSKPPAPTTGSIPVVPQPIEGEDAEVVAPVASPPVEEIMPSSRGALWSAAPPLDANGDGSTEPAAASAPHGDPFRELGDAAVRRASLDASGGNGALQPDSPVASQVASSAPRTAWFAGDPQQNAPQGAAEWSAGTPDEDPPPAAVPPMVDIPELADDEPAYTPPFGVAVGLGGAAAAATAQQDGGPEEPVVPARQREPWWRSARFLILVGLLVMAGVGYGLFVLLAPESRTVELTQEVLVAEAAQPAVEPIAIEDPTDFQAAMPGTVGSYALTGITVTPQEQTGLDVRAAEVDDLTYSDGDTELQLRAIQHYDAEDAVAQYSALAAEGTDVQPVTAGGTEVGERATVAGESGDSLVWRNGTAVFVLSGPAEQLEEFYTLFPL